MTRFVDKKSGKARSDPGLMVIQNWGVIWRLVVAFFARKMTQNLHD